MARASTIQNTTNAGELSALMLGRQDVEKYRNGLYVCYNAIPLTQGAWTRRPGFAFLHATKYNSKKSRLLPFQYTTTDTYVFEFGDLYIRLFTQHGIVTEASQSITSISQASPGVVTKNSHGYSNGDRLELTSIVGMTQLANREVQVAGATTNTFTLEDSDGNAIDTTAYGAFTSGNMAKILEIVTPYTEAQCADLRITQSADTLYVFHPSYMPKLLTRQSATSWTLGAMVLTDGPYDDTNTTTTTLSPSGATGTVTVTASATTGINGGAGFQATDVGRLIRMEEGSTWGYCQILTVGSTVSVTVSVLSTLTNTNAKTSWRLGVWSDTTGYPACGTFFQGRLWAGGATSYPQRIDGSYSGQYTNFSPSANDGTVTDANAISFTLNSNDVNAIRWMLSNPKGLLVGTARAEWMLTAATYGAALTPSSVTATPQTHYGSAAVQAVNAGRTVLFVDRAARKVRQMIYEFMLDGFKAPDMTLMSEHITYGGLTEMAYQEQIVPIIWNVRADGDLVGMTYEPDQNVTGWHRHELGGQSDAAKLFIPIVEHVCSVPAPDGTYDEVYAVVQRYVNGGTKRYVEYCGSPWQKGNSQIDAFYVDCGWTAVNSTPSQTVSGLWFLEGETLGCYVDGAIHPAVTVTNGTVTLIYAGSVVTLGYYYNSDGQTMPAEGGATDGSAQGKMKRAARLGFWLMDTLGLKYGTDPANLTEILETEWGADYGVATSLFSGVARERYEGDYDRLCQQYWRADGPFPATVLAIMPQFDTEDES